MPVFKDETRGTWYVMVRYADGSMISIDCTEVEREVAMSINMKQYSRIKADSMCESHILSAVREVYYEYRIAATNRAKQAGTVGRADLGVQKQWLTS